MGFIGGLIGNASEINIKEIEKDFQQVYNNPDTQLKVR